MELLECLFPSETGNGGSQRGIQYTEVWELLRRIFCTAVSSVWFMTASQADCWSLFFLSNPAPHIWHLRQWWCATYHVPAPSLQTGRTERSPGNERYRFNTKHSHRDCQSSPQSILLVLLVQGGKGRLSTMPRKAEIQVDLGPVHCELDISIVDRLNSLLQPQKLATTELIASHLYTSYNKHVSLVSVPKTSNENAIKHVKSL